jgi:HD superfamily phosphohydrolase
LSYFVVKKVDGKRKVALRLFKDDKYRDSVLSTCMNILDLRYELASKVYYHHTRRKARAMAVEMVGAAMKAKVLSKKDLLEMGGIELREHVVNFREKDLDEEKDSDEKKDLEEKIKHLRMAKNLANDLKKRELYEILCELRMVNLQAKERIEEIREDWKKRFEIEREIESLLGLELGSVIIFVPSRTMEAKRTLQTLVEIPSCWGSTVKTLDMLTEDDFPFEYRDIYEVIKMSKEAIIRKHELLWKLSIFVHKHIDAEKRNKIRTLCDQWFKGGAPVTAVEALAKRREIKIADPTVFTVIAEQATSGLVGSYSTQKSLFANMLDVAGSLLEQKK